MAHIVNEQPKKASLLDLEEQFAFYGQYHASKMNVAIHMFCVPTILCTTTALVNALFPYAFASIPVHLGNLLQTNIDITPAFITTAICFSAYFIALDPVAGSMITPILITLAHIGRVAQTTPGGLKIASFTFLLAWIAQFVGHGVFEGRAPALLDSLVQSLVLANFFVFMEGLFMLGYRPALHKRLQNRIGKNVLEYRRLKAAGKTK